MDIIYVQKHRIVQYKRFGQFRLSENVLISRSNTTIYLFEYCHNGCIKTGDEFVTIIALPFSVLNIDQKHQYNQLEKILIYYIKVEEKIIFSKVVLNFCYIRKCLKPTRSGCHMFRGRVHVCPLQFDS